MRIITEREEITVDYSPDWKPQVMVAERILKSYGFDLSTFMFWSAIHLYEGDVPTWVSNPHHIFPSDFLSWTLRNNCFIRAGRYAATIAELTDEQETLTESERETLEDAEQDFQRLYYDYIQSQPKEADSYERSLGDVLAFSETLPYGYLDGPEEE